jgi:hypothetical protein
MPRDGSNVYHIPPGTEGVPDTVIESAKYNTFITDIEQDANTPRAILAGGTGATSAPAALVALGAENAFQIVTNYSSQVFVAGSFSSAASATGSPVNGHAFAGIVYLADSNNLIVEARDLDDTVVPPRKYVRQKKAGIWGAWIQDFDQAAQDSRYVNVSGDTMTSDLTIKPSSPVGASLVVNKNSGSFASQVVGQAFDKTRWTVALGDNGAETGSNAGSNFAITRSDDAGVIIGTALAINRATGLVTVLADPTAPLGAATKQYADLSPKLAGGQNFTGGFTFTPFQNGNMGTGTFTFNPMNGNYQRADNNGAVQIQTPSADCAMDILIINTATAGAITFAAGFFVNAANAGDPFTTTNIHRFILSIRRISGISTYVIKALQ